MPDQNSDPVYEYDPRSVPRTRPLPYGTVTRRLPRPRVRVRGFWRRVGDFIIGLTSADPGLTQTPAERARYITIGVLMVLTTVQAFYAASLFAAVNLNKHFEAVWPYGLFFGAAVFMIDRSIIQYPAKFRPDKDDQGTENGELSEPRKASGILVIRIVVAVAAAILMSEMLLLQFFAKDIAQQISADQQVSVRAAYARNAVTYQQRIAHLTSEITAAQQLVTKRQQQEQRDYQAEQCQEFGCPGIQGGEDEGFEEAKQILNQAVGQATDAQNALNVVSQTNLPLISQLHHEETAADQQAQATILNATAVLSREEAFWQLTLKNGTVAVTRLVLTALILGIDLAPVLTKLTGRTSKHDLTIQADDYGAFLLHRERGKTALHRVALDGTVEREAHSHQTTTARFRADKEGEAERYEIEVGLAERLALADESRARAQAQSEARMLRDELAAALERRGHEIWYQDELSKLEQRAGPGPGPAPQAANGHAPGGGSPADGDPGGFDARAGADEPRARPGLHAVAAVALVGEDINDAELNEQADILFDRQQAGQRVLDDRWILHGQLEVADRGGCGTVWRAEDRQGLILGSLVVKTVEKGTAVREDLFYLQQLGLKREQQAQGLVSDNIGRIHAFGHDRAQGCDYVVYPLYTPGSLNLYCQGRPRPLPWCAEIIRQVLGGLIDAGAGGLVHLDVKPTNIVLDGSRPRIIDWGLSRAWDQNQTQTAVARGTPFYASPDQLILKPAPGWDTPLADVYGVGATFYWLITGEPPLWYDAEGRKDLLVYTRLLIEGVRPQPVRELVRGVPRPLSDLIDGWLSYERQDRMPGTPPGAALQAALDKLEALLAGGLPAVVVGEVTGRRRHRWRGRRT
jgi:hypothetical protein